MPEPPTNPEPVVYQLRIVLRDVSPLIWRRLLFRSDSTIADLQATLQLALGWSDEHLNRFVIHGREYGVWHDGGIGFRDDPRRVHLVDLGLRVRERFLYEYDFTDGWQHDVRVEQIDTGLEEAARIHGANWPRTFWYVWMPLLKPGFVAGWVIGFVFSFSELALVAFLYGPKSMVLSTLMLSLWSAGQFERGSVVAIVTTVIILAFVLGVRRLGRSSLAEGSI